MSSTVKFTSAIDRKLLKRAKVIAAKADTSINALFNMALCYFVYTFEAAEKRCNQNFEILLDFFLGRLDSLEVMDALSLESEEDLFLLMTKVRLPMPRLPDEMTKSMVTSLRLVEETDIEDGYQAAVVLERVRKGQELIHSASGIRKDLGLGD